MSDGFYPGCKYIRVHCVLAIFKNGGRVRKRLSQLKYKVVFMWNRTLYLLDSKAGLTFYTAYLFSVSTTNRNLRNLHHWLCDLCRTEFILCNVWLVVSLTLRKVSFIQWERDSAVRASNVYLLTDFPLSASSNAKDNYFPTNYKRKLRVWSCGKLYF